MLDSLVPPQRRNKPISPETIRIVRGLICGAEAAGSWSFQQLDGIAQQFVGLQTSVPTSLLSIAGIAAASGVPSDRIIAACHDEEADEAFLAGFSFAAMRVWEGTWRECRPAG